MSTASYEINVAPGSAVAYVDGSYNGSVKKFSYGIVFFYNTGRETECLTLSKAFSHRELLEMHNVAGEIMGAAEAMKRAAQLELSHITIYHDYEGIEAWCTGRWKARKVWTKKYKAFYDEIAGSVSVEFVKVKGHSGDIYNDLADSLAKQALGI